MAHAEKGPAGMTLPGASKTNSYLAAIVRASGNAIIGLSQGGSIESWNPAAEHLFGYSSEEARGQPLARLIHLDQRAEQELLATCTPAHEAGPTRLVTGCMTMDGRAIDVMLVSAAILDTAGKIIGIATTFTDITAQKQTEAALVQKEKQTQFLARQLIAAQEEERRRIALELHDQFGQSLSALHFELAALSTVPQLLAPLIERIARLQEVVAQLSTLVDQLTLELRPSALDHLGLAITLQQHIETWAIDTGIMAEFEGIGKQDSAIPSDITTALYRVVQEALTNVQKHAHARHASVILDQQDTYVSIIIEDDGDGFDAETTQQTADGQRRLGLLTMQERAASVQGTLTVKSAPGQGATVFMRVPLLPAGGAAAEPHPTPTPSPIPRDFAAPHV